MEDHNILWDLYLSMYEGYGDAKYDPDKMAEKDLPKDYYYGKSQGGKGDHIYRPLMVKGKDGKPDTETTLGTGGAYGGRKKYSPSFSDTHKQNVKTLQGLDTVLADIKSQDSKDIKKPNTAKRMQSAVDIKGKKALSDITGVGRKTNERGKGNKATRRMASMGESYLEIYKEEAE